MSERVKIRCGWCGSWTDEGDLQRIAQRGIDVCPKCLTCAICGGTIDPAHVTYNDDGLCHHGGDCVKDDARPS